MKVAYEVLTILRVHEPYSGCGRQGVTHLVAHGHVLSVLKRHVLDRSVMLR